jgi:hypothetical protein
MRTNQLDRYPRFERGRSISVLLSITLFSLWKRKKKFNNSLINVKQLDGKLLQDYISDFISSYLNHKKNQSYSFKSYI